MCKNHLTFHFSLLNLAGNQTSLFSLHLFLCLLSFNVLNRSVKNEQNSTLLKYTHKKCFLYNCRELFKKSGLNYFSCACPTMLRWIYGLGTLATLSMLKRDECPIAEL